MFNKFSIMRQYNLIRKRFVDAAEKNVGGGKSTTKKRRKSESETECTSNEPTEE